MFEYIFCLLLFESASATLNYELKYNQTLGNWTLGSEIKSVIPLEPPGFMIIFNGVQSPDISNPVIGYKLVIETLKAKSPDSDLERKNIKDVDDVIDLLQRKVKLTDFTTAFKGSPYEIQIPVMQGNNMYRICVVGVPENMQYSITVQAFTEASNGTVSKPATGYIDGKGTLRSLATILFCKDVIPKNENNELYHEITSRSYDDDD